MIEPTEDVGAVKHWLEEIDDAIKRDEDYKKQGKRIIEIYESADTKKVPFNILYSNTDTLLPALYSAVPRPVIRRRFKDDAPLALAAAEAGKRCLEYMIDTNTDGYETFHEGVSNAVLDALLPGRGVTRVKYDAEVGEYLEGEGKEIESVGTDALEDAAEPELQKESELVCVDSIFWDRTLFGYAKKWSAMPWIAFEEVIDKDEAKRLFGADVASKITFTKEGDGEDSTTSEEKQDEHQGERKTATIFQIWDKDGGRKVRYVSRHYKDGFLKVEDDPLELSGFYPIPKPIQLVAKSNDMSVTAPYLVYENQAKEINELTVRIQKLSKAIKAKFVYDSELQGDIANLMNGDDLEGIPAEKSSALSADKGFENALWFLPIEQMVNVLNQLYAAREQCKQVIYEVTGISDIIRGSTVASETATAQSIKSQWGTMRLKRTQGEVQRYCRDLLRLMLEIAATKFSEKTWVEMTSLPYATEQEVSQAQMVLQAAQAQSMQFQASGQQLPTQIQQAIQQAQATMQKPQWAQVLELLKNDMQRSYQIDIETNSTVLPEAIEDQKNIAEVMTALGQYLQGVTPLIQQGAFPFEAAKAMMTAVVRRYQFGDEIEQYINEMKSPPPPQQPAEKPDNSLQVKQMELQAAQASEQAAGMLELQKIEANRVVEQGRAATNMKIEQMRIDSAEKIAMFNAQLDRETRLEIAKIQAEADTIKQGSEMMDSERWRQHEDEESDKQKMADLYDADQERKAKAIEASINYQGE